MIKKIFALVVALVVLLLQTESKADTQYKYINGNKIRWFDRNVSICIDSSATHIPGIKEAAIGAAELWSTVPYSPNLFLSQTDYHCRINIKMGRVPKEWSFEPLAINTITNYGDGEIKSSQITLNVYYDGMFGDAVFSGRYYDLRSILYHEVGHALGLEEEYSDKSSIMYLTFFQGTTIKRELKGADTRSLVGLYQNFHLREN